LLAIMIMLALALALVVMMMAVLPTVRDFFAVIPVAMAVGGVAISVADVVVTAAASLLFSLLSQALSVPA